MHLPVADELVARLFDHRQFTHGEIDYIVKGFRDKAGIEENLNKTLRINENTCLINDLTSNGLGLLSDELASKILDQVTLLTDRAERILKIEPDQRDRSDRLLEQDRQDRLKIRQDKCSTTNAQLESLERSLIQEELDLERKYLKFEQKLSQK